jgi:hypothetical protein
MRGILLIALLGTADPSAAADPEPRLRAIANEIRGLIADVRQATAEATKENKNLIEICFRVGNLYQSARRELEEAGDANATADPLAAELIADARSLPSFCGDKERTKAEPGYEQVPRGDIVRLEKELANMDRRAKALAEK